VNLSDDDFTLFGLPQRFALDRNEVEERWRALQAKAHPDRFAAEGAAAQRVAMQWAVRINQAHQRLKDPLKRAKLLCELRGVPLEMENNTAMPAAFLMQQMGWREALEEAQGLDAVRSLDEDIAANERAMLEELRMLLDERRDTRAAAQQVRALMFVARFRADIDRRLEALGQ
jgi:molecular chaperone HscB